MTTPVWRTLKLDHTKHWREDIVRDCGGKILSVYVLDSTRHVHVCDLSPSYELWFAGFEPATLPDNEAERERVFDLLLDASLDENVDYIYCRNVRESELLSPSGDDEHRAIEEASEHYQNEKDASNEAEITELR